MYNDNAGLHMFHRTTTVSRSSRMFNDSGYDVFHRTIVPGWLTRTKVISTKMESVTFVMMTWMETVFPTLW